jgi:alpha-tubulin suppressor-like RCC1 family protein
MHSCAVRADSALWCWGDNSEGQLGINDTTDRSVPTRVSGEQRGWSEVSVGSWHTCALRTAGTLWCWGSNASWELGRPPSLARASMITMPVEIAGGNRKWL